MKWAQRRPLCVLREALSYVTLSWLYDRWLNPTLLPPVTIVYLPLSANRMDECVHVCQKERERQRAPCLLVGTLWLTGLGWLPAVLGKVPRACRSARVNGRQQGAGYWARRKGHLTQDHSWRVSCPPLPRCANSKRVCVRVRFINLSFPLCWVQISLMIKWHESFFVRSSQKT